MGYCQTCRAPKHLLYKVEYSCSAVTVGEIVTIWNDLNIEHHIRNILVEYGTRTQQHHFGHSFLTAYQIAIIFAERHPGEFDAIGKDIGGSGTDDSHSLTQYFASELSRRIRTQRITDIEGRYLSFVCQTSIEYRSPSGETVRASPNDRLSMFRYIQD